MVAVLPLSQGVVTIIDDDDYESFGAVKWSLASRRRNYATRQVNGTTVYLHRKILGAGKGEIVDHINGDGLDNRRCNLRIVNASQNGANKRRFNNKTGFKGVYASYDKWTAEVFWHGKRYRKYGFATAEDAARHYDALARIYHGEFAALNFEEETAHRATSPEVAAA